MVEGQLLASSMSGRWLKELLLPAGAILDDGKSVGIVYCRWSFEQKGAVPLVSDEKRERRFLFLFCVVSRRCRGGQLVKLEFGRN